MARRVVQWDEEAARIWWKWGSGSAAPFPGVHRAWFTFLGWVTDAIETVCQTLRGRSGSEACPLPAFLWVILPFVPATADPPNFRTMCGAASILAPPAARRGPGQSVAMTT